MSRLAALRWSVLLLSAALLPAPAMRAASQNAVVYGTVYGSDGKPLPGASVVLENPSLGFQRTTTTGADGSYNFAEVPPANGYRITAARDGRTLDLRDGIAVNVGDERVILPALGFFAANLPRAQQGDARAQLNVGLAFKNGWGVAQDNQQAVHWFTLAANQGNAAAQDDLAIMYERGWGVERDFVQAAHYARLAADQGYAYGEYRAGFYCENGKGVPKDLNQAIGWYRKAAEQGNPDARQRLTALGIPLPSPPPGQTAGPGRPAGSKPVATLLGAAFAGLGNPLAGVRVGIGPADTTTPHVFVTTGKDGAFRFFNVPAGAKYRLVLLEGERLVDSRIVEAQQGEHSLPPLIEHAGGAKTAAGDVVAAPPLGVDDVVELLTGGVSKKRVAELVEQQGVSFSLDDVSEKKIRSAGGDSDLLITIAKSRRQ